MKLWLWTISCQGCLSRVCHHASRNQSLGFGRWFVYWNLGSFLNANTPSPHFPHAMQLTGRSQGLRETHPFQQTLWDWTASLLCTHQTRWPSSSPPPPPPPPPHPFPPPPQLFICSQTFSPSSFYLSSSLCFCKNCTSSSTFMSLLSIHSLIDSGCPSPALHICQLSSSKKTTNKPVLTRFLCKPLPLFQWVWKLRGRARPSQSILGWAFSCRPSTGSQRPVSLWVR